jgi:hypothetical protein
MLTAFNKANNNAKKGKGLLKAGLRMIYLIIQYKYENYIKNRNLSIKKHSLRLCF